MATNKMAISACSNKWDIDTHCNKQNAADVGSMEPRTALQNSGFIQWLHPCLEIEEFIKAAMLHFLSEIPTAKQANNNLTIHSQRSYKWRQVWVRNPLIPSAEATYSMFKEFSEHPSAYKPAAMALCKLCYKLHCQPFMFTVTFRRLKMLVSQTHLPFLLLFLRQINTENSLSFLSAKQHQLLNLVVINRFECKCQ